MKTLLLAAAIVAAPGIALAQDPSGYRSGDRGVGYGRDPVPPRYGYQPRYPAVCRYETVAVSYDWLGRPVYRRLPLCEPVQY